VKTLTRLGLWCLMPLLRNSFIYVIDYDETL
jgi:hypothetical protein